MQPNRDSNMKTEIKLLADVPAGEGHIKIMPPFNEMYPLWQIDVLQDWIADLTNEYNKRSETWRTEKRGLRPKSDVRLKVNE